MRLHQLASSLSLLKLHEILNKNDIFRFRVEVGGLNEFSFSEVVHWSPLCEGQRRAVKWINWPDKVIFFFLSLTSFTPLKCEWKDL